MVRSFFILLLLLPFSIATSSHQPYKADHPGQDREKWMSYRVDVTLFNSAGTPLGASREQGIFTGENKINLPMRLLNPHPFSNPTYDQDLIYNGEGKGSFVVQNITEQSYWMIKGSKKKRKGRKSKEVPSKSETGEVEAIYAILEETGMIDTIEGYPCVRYVAKKAGMISHYIWTTDWNYVDRTLNAREAFGAMITFLNSKRLEMTGELAEAAALVHDLNFSKGFPVLVNWLRDDESVSAEWRLKTAYLGAPEPHIFEEPSNLTLQD